MSAFLAAVVAPAAVAQGAAPTYVARQLQQAYAEEDFLRAAQLMSPNTLAEMKGLFLDILRLDSTEAEVSLIPTPFEPLGYANQWIHVSSDSIFAAFFERLVQVQPVFGDVLRSSKAEILGSVPEGDQFSHVVVRNSAQLNGESFSQVEVISLQLIDGKWYALATGPLAQMARSIQEQLRASQ